MQMSITRQPTRVTAFAPRLRALMHDHRGEDVFRLDSSTVGVAGVSLTNQILSARPATEFERPTFKPLHGRSIHRTEASKLMQAIGRDVRAALKGPSSQTFDLGGEWPHVGHVYLRDLLLGGDPYRLRLLMDRTLELTPKLTWAVIAAGATQPIKLRPEASAIAGIAASASSYSDRRYAMGLYRRTVAPVCFTISTLVANALWLGSPFDSKASNRNILYEAMRLLPPSWNILRNASPEYPAIESRIRPSDDVLILPLLSHRDPSIWEDPDQFLPERWCDLDPNTQPGYLPFGHVSERCWGQHMVMPLAEMLLENLRANGLSVSSRQSTAEVPLTGLLGISAVKVVRE